MDKNTQQKIKEKFDTLPPDIQQAINDVGLAEKVSVIAKKNNILIDQTSSLYMEIYLALLGLEPLSNFQQNITKNVKVSSGVALTISRDVNDDIFLPIRESLEKIQLPEEDSDATNETVNPDRDQILNDIENPTPTAERATPITDPAREIETKAATNDFIANKISNSSISTTETTTIKQTPSPTVEKKYVADPYREPLN